MARKPGRPSRGHTTHQGDDVVYREVFFSDGETEISIDTEEELLAAIQRFMEMPLIGPARRPAVEDGRSRRSGSSAFVKDA